MIIVYECDKCHEQMELEYSENLIPLIEAGHLEFPTWPHQYTDNVDVDCGGTISANR
jgi:hypothetical protein